MTLKRPNAYFVIFFFSNLGSTREHSTLSNSRYLFELHLVYELVNCELANEFVYIKYVRKQTNFQFVFDWNGVKWSKNVQLVDTHAFY